MASLIPTALGPTDPDDGDEGRRLRGMAIAATTRIERNRLGYKVPSQSGSGNYIVSIEGEAGPYCSCADFEARLAPCKHVYAVWYTAARENGNGNHPHDQPVTQPPVRPSYGQHWPSYNQAQVYEQELVRQTAFGIMRHHRGTAPEDRAAPTAPV